MKRWALVLLILLIAVALLFLWRWKRPAPADVGPQTASCVDRAEAQVAAWKREGRTDTDVARLFQASLAQCSGAAPACAAFAAAVNVDYAWLGRQVLSGSLPPAEYLARVRDRSRKLRQSRLTPDLCDAYQRGDADGDLVPDDRDRCPGTPNLTPTGPDGCPDTTPPPPAPSAEEVSKAAKALKIPLTPSCRNAPVPDGSAVERLGLNPADRESFLIEVALVGNQPAGCPIFYEIEARIRNSSLFSGTLTQDSVRRVFRPADAVQISSAGSQSIVFRLRHADPIAWDALVRAGVEPSDHAIKAIRVRTVNGNGASAGWSAFRTREFRFNNRDFQ